MKRLIIKSLLGGIIGCIILVQFSCQSSAKKETESVDPASQAWSVRIAETIMKDYPDMWQMEEATKIKWAYTKGLLCDAFIDIYQVSGNKAYFDYARAWADTMINEDGIIYGYKMEDYNIDKINPGKMLFELYAETGDKRYETVIHTLRQQLINHPRTDAGGYWHKKIYPYQMWLDGLYMGSVFYARYGIQYNEPENLLDAADWIILMEEVSRDEETGLLYHAWDESKAQKWANKETGLSEHFWGRGMGWYGMALVDILDYLDSASRREEVLEIVKRFAEAIVKVQDEESGVWYQVLDQGDREGNYLEGSASAMFTYFLLKAVKKGYIDESYLDNAKKAYQGMLDNLIVVREDGGVVLTPVCAGAGLGGDPYRDGTYEYYINEKLRDNDPKGVGPFIMASLLFEDLEKETEANTSARRPNILFAISDDQSFAHTSFAGCTFVNTPAFDRVAEEGVYFNRCMAGSPGCAPSRSTIITGRYHWQNEQSGQHASSWMKKYVPFIDLLEANGYITGLTGKGVDPFQYARNENDSLWRKTNAAGIEHSTIDYKKGDEDPRPAGKIGPRNYFENFKYFMENVRQDKPFFFWYGGKEPHRSYEQDSWIRNNKNLDDVVVPDFFPDHGIVRGDLLDYAVEIEWFDLHLQRMLSYLEEIGELENTIVIVTSDNGMPFPRAKANGYDYGIHVPFAVRYPKEFPGGRIIDSPVSFADIAPTILEITETSSEGMLPISGKSILAYLKSEEQGEVDQSREYVFSGRERHSCSRYLNWGYPQRIIRSKDFLLIWNMKPERWPAGAPQRIVAGTKDELWPMYGIDENGEHHSEWAYTDIDAAPTKSYIVENREDENIKTFFDWSVAKRPEYEFFNVEKDPYCLVNLAGDPDYSKTEKAMMKALKKELEKSGDPRIVGPDKEVFDSYLRYSPMREFPNPG